MYFVIQKRHGTGGWSNAIIVKPDLNAAMLQLHGYMFTYAYGKDADLDYVSCHIQTPDGRIISGVIDDRMAAEPAEEE
jgi:hypothetical protein